MDGSNDQNQGPINPTLDENLVNMNAEPLLEPGSDTNQPDNSESLASMLGHDSPPVASDESSTEVTEQSEPQHDESLSGSFDQPTSFLPQSVTEETVDNNDLASTTPENLSESFGDKLEGHSQNVEEQEVHNFFEVLTVIAGVMTSLSAKYLEATNDEGTKEQITLLDFTLNSDVGDSIRNFVSGSQIKLGLPSGYDTIVGYGWKGRNPGGPELMMILPFGAKTTNELFEAHPGVNEQIKDVIHDAYSKHISQNSTETT